MRLPKTHRVIDRADMEGCPNVLLFSCFEERVRIAFEKHISYDSLCADVETLLLVDGTAHAELRPQSLQRAGTCSPVLKYWWRYIGVMAAGQS